MYYMKPLKIAHTYTFLTKNSYGFEIVFCIMILGFSPCFYMRIMQSENFATNIHAHYRQSETAPPYICALYAREISPPDIYENCGAFRICWRLIGRWYLCVRLYHFLYVRSSFEEGCFFWLVDWSMPKLVVKNVMKSYKFIVKMWLCICNCMCICVCIWCWLWFCCRLDSVVIRL